MDIGRRHDFGKNWADVEAKWCLGVPLLIELEKAWEALGVLELLWPEHLGEVLARNLRGFFIMAHVIDDGLTLAACQHLKGFEDVLYRIKDGRQAALPEARFAALGNPAIFPSEVVHEIPDIALIKYSYNPETAVPNVGPMITVDTDLPIMGHGSTNQTRNSVTVRYPFTDDRFELMMSRKAKQLSKDEINLFVIDLPRVPGATKRWPLLAKRRLQPEIYRRFSAIIHFFRYMDNNTGVFVQHCYIEQHPNPYKKLSESLLSDLRSLNTAPES